jgi:Polyketide cyclase / dehydrase and lipid transport
MFLTEFHGIETIELSRTPSEVFDLLVDVEQLPGWNAHVHHVITPPDRPLAEGVEWVIQMRAMGTKWPSRARALTVDRAGMHFEHRSCSDDGNPTYGLWSWQVVPTPGGCQLTVSWTVHPRSFWRKLLLARLRRPVLADEVRASLAGLDGYLQRQRSEIEHQPN